MGTCCVPGCKSGSGKGIKKMRLFKFPKDPKMKKRWMRHLRYDQEWEPTRNATVCGLHFSEDAYLPQELNVDCRGNKRKLKNLKKDAIPTIFEVKKLTKKGRKKSYLKLPPPPCPVCTENEMLAAERRDLEARSIKREPTDDHNYVSFGKDDEPKPSRFSIPESMISNVVSVPVLPDSSLKIEDDEIPYDSVKNAFLDRKVQMKIKELEKENAALKAKVSGVMKIFNSDQVNRLSGNKKSAWSDPTVSQSLKVRYACGDSGYEYLRSMGYPLPSLIVIEDHINQLKVPAEVLSEATSLMKNRAPEKEVPQEFESLENVEIVLKPDYDGFDMEFAY